MDGWGIAKPDKFNAIDNARTPNFDRLVREFPNTQLKSDGLAVGLPEGQFGTSEVNHLTIGAGRIILQDLPRINKEIEDETFYENEALLKTTNHVIDNNSKLHLVGILSDGKVHSSIEHVFAIFELLHRQNFKQGIFLHVFTDGRDVAPKSADKFFLMLEDQIAKYQNLKIKIASVQGRFYLDRDRDWQKTDTCFGAMSKNEGANFKDWQSVLNFEYNQNKTDEYFGNYVIDQKGMITKDDGVIFFHYRTDRLFQIVSRVLKEKLENLSVSTFISVSDEFKDVNIAFPRLEVSNTLAEIISENGKKQLHITETEKYAHLTFFLNGEKEKEMPNETWSLIESNRFIKPYYNLEPSMRNFDIAKEVVDAITHDKYDFIIINLSSPDMVGHTGSYEAAVVSAEAVDYCVGQIYNAISAKLEDYSLLITADHGNSDIMWDYENDQPHTQHTTSPVPFVLVSDLNAKLHRRESLSDIAPTVLDLMGLDKPKEMTGESLIIK